MLGVLVGGVVVLGHDAVAVGGAVLREQQDQADDLGLAAGGMMGHAQYQLMTAPAAKAAADVVGDEREES